MKEMTLRMRNCQTSHKLRWVIWLPLAAACGCKPPPGVDHKSAAPAKVENPVKEAELSTIHLTPEAESRLGIKTVEVETKEIQRTRTLGGEVTAAPGAAITLSAPFAGTIRTRPAGDAPAKPDAERPGLTPGQLVKKGEIVLVIEPMLPAEARASLLGSRAEAEGAFEAAKAEAEAAKVGLRRAEQLLQDKAGSRRAVEEARARLDIAEAAVRAGSAKRDLYASLLVGTGAGALVSLPIPSPFDGMVTRILAVPGQLVAAGAPLVEILDAQRLWIRVPVYVGDLPEIATEAEVRIGVPGETSGVAGKTARSVAAPPSGDIVTATVDLYYEPVAPEPRGAQGAKEKPLAPGQRVAVVLPLRGHEGSLVVPWSSVVHDSQGGTWVYERIAPQTFVRRRVQVRFVVGGLASLAEGPKPGAAVVSEGTAELFGTEFGVGK